MSYDDMHYTDQQKYANTILRKVKAMDPNALLAGGAPRDWWFKRTATDLDILVFLNPKLTLTQMRTQLDCAGFQVKEILMGDAIPQDYKLNPNIRCVINLNDVKMPVQLVVYRESTYQAVEKFPLSICQAWWNGTWVVGTRLFQKTAELGVIIKTGEAYADGHKYIQKVLAKFPDMKYYSSYQQYAKTVIGF